MRGTNATYVNSMIPRCCCVYDDPAVLLRLYSLSTRLRAEVKREAQPNISTLVKAQAALAIDIL